MLAHQFVWFACESGVLFLHGEGWQGIVIALTMDSVGVKFNPLVVFSVALFPNCMIDHASVCERKCMIGQATIFEFQV